MTSNANTTYACVTDLAGNVDYYELTQGSANTAQSLLTDAVSDGNITSFQLVNSVPAGNITNGYIMFKLFMSELMLGLD